jgi:hypothetical protein
VRPHLKAPVRLLHSSLLRLLLASRHSALLRFLQASQHFTLQQYQQLLSLPANLPPCHILKPPLHDPLTHGMLTVQPLGWLRYYHNIVNRSTL